MEIERVPDEPTLADVVQLLKKWHDCTEQRFNEAAAERAAIAAQVQEDRRSALRRAGVAAKAVVRAQKEARSAADAAKAAEAKVEDVRHALSAKIDAGWAAFNRTGWKLVASIGGIILTGVIGVVATNVAFTRNVATKDDVAARTALRYTSEDATRDRQAQDARDQQLLSAIAEIERRLGK